jgi:hypothetical protein
MIMNKKTSYPDRGFHPPPPTPFIGAHKEVSSIAKAFLEMPRQLRKCLFMND